ncbi:beta strand repeat-containing protein [Rhodopila sp.]|uniref:beta strand repeat-containing protein n=1 Tax=Rhodopila sp. TaxID=2480087 RepID=UPI003D09B251
MSGSSTVTIPGTNGTPITVSYGTGDVLHLAAQIGALLSTLQGSGNLQVTNGTMPSLPPAPAPTTPGAQNELIFNGNADNATVPSGYSYAIDLANAPSTLSAANTALITSTVAGTINITGQSTVAVENGNNLVNANGNYLISTAPGNDTISASGTGTIATDIGANVIFATGVNSISSIGQDTVVAGLGLTTVNSAGSMSLVMGNAGAGDLLTVSLSGAQSTVSTWDSDATVTVAGGQDMVVGAQALSNLIVTGSSDTLVGGSGAETINALSNPLLFGGTGPVSFVGGAGASTIMGASGGIEQVTVGAGGVMLSAGAGNSSTVTSGAGATTIFGGANSIVNFVGNQNGAVLVGASGNETLNAAGSTTTNLFSGGVGGNVSMQGGSGNDGFLAGSGSDTMAGGAGSNSFAFFSAATSGAHDYITDFSPSDSLFLLGYAPGQSASSLLSAATEDSTGVTLTLSDETKITFTNLNSASSLNGEIMYVPKVG